VGKTFATARPESQVLRCLVPSRARPQRSAVALQRRDEGDPRASHRVAENCGGRQRPKGQRRPQAPPALPALALPDGADSLLDLRSVAAPGTHATGDGKKPWTGDKPDPDCRFAIDAAPAQNDAGTDGNRAGMRRLNVYRLAIDRSTIKTSGEESSGIAVTVGG